MQAMREFFSLVLIIAAFQISPSWSREVIYGKYYSIQKASDGKDERYYGDNAYYVYLPPKNLHIGKTNPYSYANPKKSFRPLAPTVMHFYGCGWRNCGFPWKTPSSVVGELNRQGIAVVSVGYRRITTFYWYDDPQHDGKQTPEELIHVDAEGRLTLDMEGRTFINYQPRICRHEYITKSLYDGQQAMSNLVSTAFEEGLDLNRLVFWAYSAGGSLSQYLIHIHHQWNVGSYTPRGMFYRSSMLDLPTANVLDRVWYDIQRSLKDTFQTKLKDLINHSDCWWVVGNGCESDKFKSYMQPGMPYNLCNHSWDHRSMTRFCGIGFQHVTIGDLIMEQRWPRDDPEVGRGMERIWYTSENMRKHMPSPFYVLLVNLKSEDYGLLHSSLYIPGFKRAYHEAGAYYTAYYDGHPLMVDYNDTKASPRDVTIAGGHRLKYHSNHGWRELLDKNGISKTGDIHEYIKYVCYVLQQPGCSPELKTQPARLLSSTYV